jgi:hypothetical protein
MVIVMRNLMMMMMMMMMIWTIMVMIMISFSSHLWAMIILARQKSMLPKKVSWKMVCSFLYESLKLNLSFKIICSVLYKRFSMKFILVGCRRKKMAVSCW